MSSLAQLANRAGHAQFGQKQRFQIEPRLLATGFAHHVARLSFRFDRGAKDVLRNTGQLRRLPNNGFLRRADVAFLTGLLQHVPQGGPRPQWRGAIHTQTLGQLIRGLETEAPNVGGQAIRIATHQFDGLVAIRFVDAHRPSSANAVGLQKNHDVAHRFLLMPAFANALDTPRTNSLNFLQKSRTFVNDLQGALAKDSDNLPGIVRPDALDQSGAEVFLDSLD